MSDDKLFYKGYRYEIKPTDEQKEKINKYISLYRYVYNWAIDLQEQLYDDYLHEKSSKRFYSYFDLTMKYTELVNSKGMEWLKELPIGTARKALKSVINAYNMFFKNLNRKPKYKSKKRSPKSFRTRQERCYITNNMVQIEGFGKNAFDLRFDTGFDRSTKIINPQVSIDTTGRYWFSFSVQQKCISLFAPETKAIGIDLGVRQTFALSTGEVFNQPDTKRLERRLNRIKNHVNRDINRRFTESQRTKTKYEDIPKSKRSQKRELKMNKLFAKIHNIKNTFYDTVIKNITDRNPSAIVMEDIRVKNLMYNKKFMAKPMSSVSFYSIITKMRNKCNYRSIRFIQADRRYPSTQLCSNCGSIKKMYSLHTYKCPVCGMVEDRDINAAKNLEFLAYL